MLPFGSRSHVAFNVPLLGNVSVLQRLDLIHESVPRQAKTRFLDDNFKIVGDSHLSHTNNFFRNVASISTARQVIAKERPFWGLDEPLPMDYNILKSNNS